jgi:hypothetical protein
MIQDATATVTVELYDRFSGETLVLGYFVRARIANGSLYGTDENDKETVIARLTAAASGTQSTARASTRKWRSI